MNSRRGCQPIQVPSTDGCDTDLSTLDKSQLIQIGDTMPLNNDLYSVTIVDTMTEDHEPDDMRQKLRSQIINYFNLGINEYKYPMSNEMLGDMVQTVVKDLNVTDSGLTSVPYEKLSDGVKDSQAIFVITDKLYTNKFDSIIRKYRSDYYIDFIQV